MRLGIIGAMDEEIHKLKNIMQEVHVYRKANMEFYSGRLQDKEVVLVRSGIGKVNAAICTQILVDEYEVTHIINTGIAGSLKNEINIGDIVLSTDAIQHDVEAIAFGYPAGQIPRMDVLSFQADVRLKELAQQSFQKLEMSIHIFEGRVLSGDQFISSHEKKQWLADTFQGYCTEMEGASIAQTAYLNNIPFLIIRAISDKADDSASVNYSEFEAEAIENSFQLVKEMIEHF